MKTKIITVILSLMFFAGCGGTYSNPYENVTKELDRQQMLLEREGQMLMNDITVNKQALEVHSKEADKLFESVTPEQTIAIDEAYLQLERKDISELGFLIELQNILSPAQYQEITVLEKEYNDLVEESNQLRVRAEAYQRKYADYQQRCMLILNVALAQSAANRRYRQQEQNRKYQQQQLYQLGEINRNLQDLWMQQQNQKGGVIVLPAPRPLSPY